MHQVCLVETHKRLFSAVPGHWNVLLLGDCKSLGLVIFQKGSETCFIWARLQKAGLSLGALLGDFVLYILFYFNIYISLYNVSIFYCKHPKPFGGRGEGGGRQQHVNRIKKETNT